MKILIIEDEPFVAKDLENLILRLEPSATILTIISSVEKAKKWFESNPLPDLVFSDIQLSDGISFEIFEGLHLNCPVIFTTAYDEYAIRAFESNAVDYLLKPFSEERFRKAVDKFLEKSPASVSETTNTLLDTVASSPNQAERIVVKTGNKVKIIPTHEIHYLEADDDYVKIVTQEGSFLKNRTMQFYEKTLDPKFFVRVHRSYILHVNQITRIDPYQKETHLAVLRDGKQIPVSKSGYSRLKEILGL